jgi:hypothetical protein
MRTAVDITNYNKNYRETERGENPARSARFERRKNEESSLFYPKWNECQCFTAARIKADFLCKIIQRKCNDFFVVLYKLFVAL